VAQAIGSWSRGRSAAARTGDVPAVVKADRLKAPGGFLRVLLPGRIALRFQVAWRRGGYGPTRAMSRLRATVHRSGGSGLLPRPRRFALFDLARDLANQILDPGFFDDFRRERAELQDVKRRLVGVFERSVVW
jgi:hypothetical protein